MRLVQLYPLDWGIILAYFVFVFIVGLWYTRRAGQSVESFFISGRTLPWWLLGISMVATTFSTDTPNLVADLVRTHGIAGNWLWWAMLVTGMVTTFFYAKLWRRSGALTDLEFYEFRYSGKAAAVVRGFRALYLGVFFNCIIMAAVTMAAMKIGSVFGLSRLHVAIVCNLVTLIYCVMSGFWAVVVTDLFQFVIAMAGSIAMAHYVLQRPEVGGLSKVVEKLDVSALSLLPDFSNPGVWIPLFFIPFAVQWWSTWYPGAEPGGGGYIAQRMLATPTESGAMKATLIFQVAHYALRPWPWIVVALASMIVFPSLGALRAVLPAEIPDQIVKNDIAYPVMMRFLPHGLLGMMLASLAAAYMSTIDTHLNWGASYVINDFYRRFLRPTASERHHVTMARLSTVVLMIMGTALAFAFQNAQQTFQIMLQVGAGTGAIYILRWYWWRINAWSEVAGMVGSFVVAVGFYLLDRCAPTGCEAALPFLFGVWRLPVSVGLTTACWLIVTFLTKPESTEHLEKFYEKVRPGGWWGPVKRPPFDAGSGWKLNIVGVLLGCFSVYAMLLGVGEMLIGKYPMLGFAALASGLVALLIVTGIIQRKGD